MERKQNIEEIFENAKEPHPYLLIGMFRNILVSQDFDFSEAPTGLFHHRQMTISVVNVLLSMPIST
jgi:hypothetical protein